MAFVNAAWPAQFGFFRRAKPHEVLEIGTLALGPGGIILRALAAEADALKLVHSRDWRNDGLGSAKRGQRHLDARSAHFLALDEEKVVLAGVDHHQPGGVRRF